MAHYGIDELSDSMVQILHDDGKRVIGSGFIIRHDGYLITCHHVIYWLQQLLVEYLGQTHEAQWCEDLSDPEVDLAVLKIDVQDAEAAPIVYPQDFPTPVTVRGFPESRVRQFPQGYDVPAQLRGGSPVATLSTYKNRETGNTHPWNRLPQAESTFLSYHIDASVQEGTSGGPVLADAIGGVVGVMQSSRTGESYVIRWDNIIGTLIKLEVEPVCRFLKDIEDRVKNIKLFHTPQEILLENQYIPVQVTPERRYRHEIETSWGYAESHEELKRAYALKGMVDESQPSQVDWQEAKKAHQRLMVLADPGMGKSTLLKMEALRTAQEERRKLLATEKGVDDLVFPILLRLSDLNEHPDEVRDAICNLIGREYPTTSASIGHLLRKKLETGNCLLLLDALDEVPYEHRNPLAEKFNRFARSYPCPIICTSRIVGYAGTFVDNAKDVEIVPFSQKQIWQYADAWFDNAADFINDDSVSAAGLRRELELKPQIRGLTQNPLLLSLLCSLYQVQELTLPAHRCQVYGQAVKYMLGPWRNQRTQQDAASIDIKIEDLEGLAYHFSCQGQDVFSLREMRRYFERDGGMLRNEAVRLVTELTEEDGVIQKLDRAGDKYIFLHRTFQEYLTASYLSQHPDCLNLAKALFWDYDWHETLILLAGLMKDPIPLIAAITGEKDDIFFSLLLLAGQCLAECDVEADSIVSEIFDLIYRLWRFRPVMSFIKTTVIRLGQSHPQFFDMLHQGLQDEDHAASALGEIGSDRAINVLIDALNDEDSSVRCSAASALGKMGSDRATDTLINALNHEDIFFRRIAAFALGEIGSDRAINALINTIDDKDTNVRWNAMSALEDIGSECAIDALIDALNNEDNSVRCSAASALGKIGGERATDELINAFDHEDSLFRTHVASALDQIGNDRAIDTLINALTDEDTNVRWHAVSALRKIDSNRATDVCIDALTDEDSLVRVRAASALGEIGSDRATDVLINVLTDGDSLVRGTAAFALGKIGNDRAINVLIDTLNDKDSLVIRFAASALEEIGGDSAIDALAEILTHEDSSVRQRAAEALKKIANLNALQKLLQCPKEHVSSEFFSLARTLAIRFRKENTGLIPVYPELIGNAP